MAAVDNKQAVAVDYDKLRDAIKSFGTRVLIVDPFVQTHQMNENDNQQINFVADLFRSIAKECHIAVMLVHHTRKGAEFGSFPNYHAAFLQSRLLTGFSLIFFFFSQK